MCVCKIAIYIVRHWIYSSVPCSPLPFAHGIFVILLCAFVFLILFCVSTCSADRISHKAYVNLQALSYCPLAIYHPCSYFVHFLLNLIQ